MRASHSYEPLQSWCRAGFVSFSSTIVVLVLLVICQDVPHHSYLRQICSCSVVDPASTEAGGLLFLAIGSKAENLAAAYLCWLAFAPARGS